VTVSLANRTGLFIDGANLHSTGKARGFDIDYKRLLKELQSHGTLVRAFYHHAVTEDRKLSSVPISSQPSVIANGAAGRTSPLI
jgi:NYN domain